MRTTGSRPAQHTSPEPADTPLLAVERNGSRPHPEGAVGQGRGPMRDRPEVFEKRFTGRPHLASLTQAVDLRRRRLLHRSFLRGERPSEYCNTHWRPARGSRLRRSYSAGQAAHGETKQEGGWPPRARQPDAGEQAEGVALPRFLALGSMLMSTSVSRRGKTFQAPSHIRFGKLMTVASTPPEALELHTPGR
jgi:hypothetical protein